MFMRRHLRHITVRWMCLSSDLYSSVFNINQHLFFVLNPWVVVRQHLQQTLYGQNRWRLRLLDDQREYDSPLITQYYGKDVALIFKVKIGTHVQLPTSRSRQSNIPGLMTPIKVIFIEWWLHIRHYARACFTATISLDSHNN